MIFWNFCPAFFCDSSGKKNFGSQFLDPKEDFESPIFEKNSENFEKWPKITQPSARNLYHDPGWGEIQLNFHLGGCFFRNFHLAGVFFFRNFHLGGCFFPKFSPRGVFFRKNGRKSRNLARAKSPNLSPFGLKFSGQDNPLGGTVVDSQKYLESRKSAGWWSGRGYAVYLDLESRDSMFSKYFWESTTGFPRQVLRMIPAPPQTPWGGGGPRFFSLWGGRGWFFFSFLLKKCKFLAKKRGQITF